MGERDSLLGPGHPPCLCMPRAGPGTVAMWIPSLYCRPRGGACWLEVSPARVSDGVMGLSAGTHAQWRYSVWSLPGHVEKQ